MFKKIRTLLCLLFLVSLTFSCANVHRISKSRLSSINQIDTVIVVEDIIAGHKSSYMGAGETMQETTVDWKGTTIAKSKIEDYLLQKNFNTQSMQYDIGVLRGVDQNLNAPNSPNVDVEIVDNIVQHLRKKNPQNNADAWLVVLPNFSYFYQQDVDLLHEMPSMLLMGTANVEQRYIRMKGFGLHKSLPPSIYRCSYGFEMYLIDNKTEEKLAYFSRAYPVEVKDIAFMPKSYNDFPDEQKNTIKQACLDSLNQAFPESLGKMGL